MTSRQGATALVSLAGALVVLAGKSGAYFLTGSVSLLSDAAESIVNVVAAVAVILAVRLALRPPDYEHPYGHEKAEILSSAFEALLIIAAAAMLLLTGVQRLLDPVPLRNIALGLGVAAGAGALNLGLALWLGRRARLLGSAALQANSRHLLTDVWSSVGVIIGVALVAATGWLVLDAVIALVVAANIFREGYVIMTRSISQLLDERLPDAEEALIMRLLDGHSGIMGYHRLRSRRSGSARFLEVDVFVEPGMRVDEAHAMIMRLEAELSSELPNLISTIHIEPHAPGVRDGSTHPREEFDQD